MNRTCFMTAIIFGAAFIALISCKKNPSCATCGKPKPPVAIARPDTILTLPTDSVQLDGSTSYDPDGSITGWQWKKISGPISSVIVSATSAVTLVRNLVAGTYQYELKVTDNSGLTGKDTISITVTDTPSPSNCDPNRPVINAQLIPVGVLSQARIRMAVASAGNKILFAGGDGNVPLSESSRVDIFDVAANSWSTAELSYPRVWIGAVASENKIFFAGGQNDGYSYDNVDIFDVSTNNWTVSHLSRAADGLAAAAVGDKVFFAGGNWGVYATNVVDIYSLTSNTWSTASLGVPRNFVTGVAANNKVFFAGGYTGSFQNSNVIDVYDNTANSWSTSTMQLPRSYHAGVAVNDIVYFAGADPSTCSVETLNANTGARTFMNLFGADHWMPDEGENAVVKDNKIILLRHNGGSYASRFDIYDIQNNSWSIGVLSQPLPERSSVICVNNTIYVAGGLVSGGLSNQVWKLQF